MKDIRKQSLSHIFRENMIAYPENYPVQLAGVGKGVFWTSDAISSLVTWVELEFENSDFEKGKDETKEQWALVCAQTMYDYLELTDSETCHPNAVWLTLTDEVQEELERRESKRKDKEIQLLAEKYANLIEPQMEHFRDTVTRLSEVIESPYNDEAFTRAIQIIRTRYGNMKVLKEDTFSVTIEMTKEDYYNIINSFIDIGANKLKNDFPIAFPSIDRFVMLHGVEKGLYGEINKLLGK